MMIVWRPLQFITLTLPATIFRLWPLIHFIFALYISIIFSLDGPESCHPNKTLQGLKKKIEDVTYCTKKKRAENTRVANQREESKEQRDTPCI